MDTFTWYHNANPSGTVKFRTLSARFGDGYEQTAPDGINNKLESWPLTFEGTSAAITNQNIPRVQTRHTVVLVDAATWNARMYKCKT
jgi:phage-related protein